MIKPSQFTLDIYLKSLTIRERFKNVSGVKNVIIDESLDKKIAYWKLQVGETSDAFFKKRLKWSNINEPDLPKLLSPLRSLEFTDKMFPEWLNYLDEFLISCKDLESEELVTHVPFSDVLIPLVNFFASKLTYNSNFISPGAVLDLKIGLLKLLSKLSSQSLLEHMHQKEKNYNDFVALIREDNYRDFFLDYSYLSRLIFTRGVFWMNRANFLLKVLEDDSSYIAGKLGVRTNDIHVLDILVDLSESHNKGKNVAVIKTNKGNFVFKNRSTDIEHSFFEFLKYINLKSQIKQYIPWIIKRNGYGWMEYIAQKKCEDETEVVQYYERVGSLLCLFYLFGATDLHSENIISKGSYPVFIDLETLLSPLTKLNNKYLNRLNEYIDYKYGLSVSRVGILPQWLLGPDTQVYNNSALGGAKRALKYPALIWKNIGSDSISYEYLEIEAEENKNLVYLGSKIQDPSKYTSNVITGFKSTYKLLRANKEDAEFLDKLHGFANKETRFVFRATKVYTLLLDYLNHPDYMCDGVSRSLELEILAKGLLMDLDKKYIFWNVLNDELEQLENGDIPYFTTNTSSKELRSLNRVLYKEAFQYTSYSKLLTLLKKFDKDDLNFQLGIIKNSLETKTLENTESIFKPYSYSCDVFSKPICIDKVLFDIKDRIVNSRIEIEQRTTWVGYVSNIISHTYGYKPIGVDTANGNMGVALFLGALYSYSQDEDYLSLVKSTVLPIIDMLKESWSKREFMLRFGTGGTTGVGSIIYGFAKLFEFTQDNAYRDLAVDFVNVVSSSDIEKSLRQDVVSGNAGLLLALVKLYEISPSVYLEDLMKKCYIQIVKTGFIDDKFINWDYQQKKKLLGFSHGSSGILYALSRYLPYCGTTDELEKLLNKILVYEKKFFDITKGNWPDYRFDHPDFDVVSWCHGAVGIGMSRLELLNQKIEEEIVTLDINNSLKKIISTGQHSLDTVCCGNGGRIDFILELRTTDLFNKKIEDYLHWLVNRMLLGYHKRGDFNYFSKFKTEDINVGFYQGLSGIGYQLLRYTDPDKFESILLYK